MKTLEKYHTLEIYHNEFGMARPKAYASNGYKFNFNIEVITNELRSKIWGLNGSIELTFLECKELFNAKNK